MVDDSWKRTVTALGSVLERITPWLLDLGNWIFGALIAFNLVILGALLTVGPVDHAAVIATAAFALALPVDVAGFLLLRLASDLKTVDLEQVATSAFVEAGFAAEDRPAAPDPQESEKRRARITLRYSYGLLALAVLLTLVGLAAALWHMSWWIAIAFVVMVLLTQAVVAMAISSTGSNARWRGSAGRQEKS